MRFSQTGVALFVVGICWSIPAQAQTFRIIGGGGNTFGYPPPACAFDIQDNEPVSDQRLCENADATWDMSITRCDRGDLEVFRHANWHSPCGCTLGTECNGQAQLVNNTAPDLIISGPPGEPQVSAVFRVDVEGTAQADPDAGVAFANFYTRARVAAVMIEPGCGSGCTNVNGRLSSSPASFPVNTPLTYELYISAATGVRGLGTPTATTHVRMQFPIGEPVFLLPDGYTVNCPTLNIVDNFWVPPDAPCPGDVNADNVVNLSDLSILLTHFGITSGATLADGDLDLDGDVDLSDLSTMLTNFGSSCT
ncbi:MAG: hypothetical protein HRF50_07305 [Phycisphaerae bacterium]